MKSVASDPTRWSCRLVRTWRSLLGRAGGEHGFGSRHIASCADCQRFFAAGAGLEAALRREARQTQIAPTGLDERIMQAIDRSVRPAPPRYVRPVVLAIAGAAAAVAVGLWFWPKTNPTPGNGQAGHGEVAMTSESTASQPWTVLRPSVDALLRQDPLQTEVDSVYADARTAVHFLALNFLPSAATPGRNGKSSPNDRAAGG